VQAHPDVIVVTIKSSPPILSSHRITLKPHSYRLDIFGFPTSPALKKINVGLHDQRAAIEWLYKNLPAFGGDADRITLFGQSAGAQSISAYVYSYPDRPLVHGVIMESGTVELISGGGPPNFQRVANATGCGGGSDEDVLRCMKTLDVTAIRRAVSDKELNWYAISPNGGTPRVDNETIFTQAEWALRGAAGKFAQIVGCIVCPVPGTADVYLANTSGK
jgi:carboxylesterase type B